MRDIQVKCEASARLNPSEDPKALEKAISLLAYPGVSLESVTKGDEVHVTFLGPSTLRKLKDQAAYRKIRSVLRRLILSNYSDGKVTLMLNRQALTVGIIALVENERESPLGPVYLTIYSTDLKGLCEYLTSHTEFHR